MAISGKSSKSLRKKDLANQVTPSLGFKTLSFYHKATAGDTGINLSALSLPTEVTGFVNATSTEIASANLLVFKKNLKLVSSSKGLLLPELSYKVVSNTQITFTSDFGTAEDGEIFYGVIESASLPDGLIADTDFMVASGTLAANTTDISLGRSFKTNDNSAQQMGRVMVFVGGQLLFRNVGNATASASADGNYQELDNGFGEFSVIRLNAADSVNARPYLVVSSVLSTIKPNGSILDLLQSQQGTIDTIIATLAPLAGVPSTDFQATPSQPNLKQFGDRVISLEATRALTPDSQIRVNGANGHGSSSTNIRRFVNAVTVGTDIVFADSATSGSSFTVNRSGIYAISYSDTRVAAATSYTGISLNASGAEQATSVEDLSAATRLILGRQNGTEEYVNIGVTIRLNAGDVIRAHTDATPSETGARVQFVITQVVKFP